MRSRSTGIQDLPGTQLILQLCDCQGQQRRQRLVLLHCWTLGSPVTTVAMPSWGGYGGGRRDCRNQVLDVLGR
eukprot:1160046-Pelagomonas_calceolata.AAC.2